MSVKEVINNPGAKKFLALDEGGIRGMIAQDSFKGLPQLKQVGKAIGRNKVKAGHFDNCKRLALIAYSIQL